MRPPQAETQTIDLTLDFDHLDIFTKEPPEQVERSGSHEVFHLRNKIEKMEAAMEAGWEPYFYERETEQEFACPSCAEKFLQEDENGEMEVKEEYRGKLVYHDQCKGQGEDLKDEAEH